MQLNSMKGCCMSKKVYKELRKKLKNHFVKPKGNYGVPSAVGEWFLQSDITPTKWHLEIVCNIFGSVPYPHQEDDRLFVITYLKRNKYREYIKTKN